MNLLVLFLLLVSLVRAFPERTILSNNLPASCIPLKVNGYADALVTIKLTKYENFENEKGSKIPFIIFNFADLEELKLPTSDRHFANLREGNLNSAAKLPLSLKDYLNFEKGKFTIGKTDASYKTGSFKGLDAEHKFALDVQETGFYCVYIVPLTGSKQVLQTPPDSGNAQNSERKSTPTFEIEIEFKNSYGYLPYKVYTELSELGLFVNIIICASIVMAYFTSRKIGSLKLSVISFSFAYYIVLPLLVINGMKVIAYGYINKFSSKQAFLYYDSTWELEPLIISILKFIEEIYFITTRWFLLLFTMGYGVIYCMENSKNYRRIPSRFWNKALSIYLINLSTFSLKKLLENYFDRFYRYTQVIVADSTGSGRRSSSGSRVSGGAGGMGRISGSKSNANEVTGLNRLLKFRALIVLEPYLDICNEFFPIFWFLLSAYYFLTTLKSIRKFSDNSSSSKSSVASAYFISIIFVIVIPLVVGIIITALDVGHIQKFRGGPNNRRAGGGGGGRGTPRPLEDVQREMKELASWVNAFLDRSFQIQSIWSEYTYILLTLFSIYFIWVKDNLGIVINNLNDANIVKEVA